MSVAAPPSYDHAVVARRRAARSGDIAKTLKATRERLSSRGGLAPGFDRELLTQHAAALQAAAIVLPLPVILTGLGLSVFTGPLPAILWTGFALLGYLALVLLSRRFATDISGRLDVSRWAKIFVVGHVAAGLSWAYLATLSCADCVPLRFEIFQFTVLFLAIAMIAMISSTLKAVVPLTFLPMVLVLGYGIVAAPQPVLGAMHAVLIGAVPFFAVVAETLRRAAIAQLKHQSEKDELITELDIARVMSDEARLRAEEANLAKSRFLATMSHELRTPLNAILGFSEVMSNEILGPVGNDSYKEYVADIHASGQHLLGLINEILDLSRVEAGRYNLDEEAIELVPIARACIGYIKVKAKAKNLVVRSEFEKDLPAMWADERSLRQIIINLLSNAVKFTPRGGEIVLRVGWTAGGGQYVSVKDNGPGIPEEEIPIVLSSFGQGSIAIKSAEQGTGLGLPIVQALVKMHGGSFELLSRLREGTEAIAIFPNSRVLEVMPALDEQE
ncbi:sensor histidine kinase [Aurantimonas marina]|uniref:sensor histidine kinase n=1 Tax=Aurantimonas marina TaxID=2780508 RepID=UPI0019D1947F|nr:HAMP domain-containing sensor histidine kinase [Aurantimonas marina]